jgi:glycosyltransferase involved in cell wall biosynthesis
MMAFADVIERHLALKERVAKSKDPNKVVRPVLLMVATQMDGFWNLMDILEHQLKLRGISMDVGKEYIVTLAKPQQMSDFEINVLYNACDVGLNTCEGEGFGLCQFEHAAVGCPQVVANIGGFKEFLHSGNSTLVDVKWNYYIDKQRDGIGGYAEVSDHKDIADGLWKYFGNSGLVTKHGARARSEILHNYRWETVVNYFHRVLKDIAK